MSAVRCLVGGVHATKLKSGGGYGLTARFLRLFVGPSHHSVAKALGLKPKADSSRRSQSRPLTSPGDSRSEVWKTLYESAEKKTQTAEKACDEERVRRERAESEYEAEKERRVIAESKVREAEEAAAKERELIATLRLQVSHLQENNTKVEKELNRVLVEEKRRRDVLEAQLGKAVSKREETERKLADVSGEVKKLEAVAAARKEWEGAREKEKESIDRKESALLAQLNQQRDTTTDVLKEAMRKQSETHNEAMNQVTQAMQRGSTQWHQMAISVTQAALSSRSAFSGYGMFRNGNGGGNGSSSHPGSSQGQLQAQDTGFGLEQIADHSETSKD